MEPDQHLVVISSDTHAGADLYGYRPYLVASMRDEFDAWASDFRDGWAAIDDAKVDTDDDDLRIGVASFLSPYNWDSDLRTAHLESQGVAGEVIFPNTVPPFFPSGVIGAPGPSTAEEYRRRWAGVQAHNRWLVDFCARAPGRRAGIAQVFLNDVDDAIAEVRWAAKAGLAGILVPGDHHRQLVPLHEPRLDPFWSACVEAGLPVHQHTIVVGDAETAETGPQAPALGVYEAPMFMQRSLGHMILGGVFERHPGLQYVMTEIPTAWIPGELANLDGWTHAARRPGSMAHAFSARAVERLGLLPSQYFRRHCHIGRSLMTSRDVELRHDIGVDRIMWGLDYPHHEGTWPHTQVALRLNFAGVPHDEVIAMASGNAAHLYGFDLAALQAVADRIGPTFAEIDRPVEAHEVPRGAMCPTFDEAERRLVGTTP